MAHRRLARHQARMPDGSRRPQPGGHPLRVASSRVPNMKRLEQKLFQQADPAVVVFEQDELVQRMGALADQSQTVQCWDTEGCREVAIAGAAHGDLCQLKAQLACYATSHLVERHYARSALEGRAVETAADLNAHFVTDRPEATQCGIDR